MSDSDDSSDDGVVPVEVGNDDFVVDDDDDGGGAPLARVHFKPRLTLKTTAAAFCGAFFDPTVLRTPFLPYPSAEPPKMSPRGLKQTPLPRNRLEQTTTRTPLTATWT